MALSDALPVENLVSEHWPGLVAIAVILLGNVYYHGVLGREFTPVSPPLLVGIVVFLALEVARQLHERSERGE